MKRSITQSPINIYLCLGFIFCLALITGNIFGHIMLRLNNGVVDDINGFGALGKQFATFGNLAGSIRRGPVYPVFLGLVYKLFGASGSSLIFSQSALLGLLGIIAFFTSFFIFKSFWIAFITGIVTVIFPALLWYVDRLYLELIFSLLVLLMIGLAYRALTNSTWWNLALFGISAGIAALCKAILLLFPIFLACIVLIFFLLKVKPFNFLNKNILLKFFIFPSLVMLITISPWTIRNYMVSGTLTLVSSNTGLEFYRGNIYADQNSFLLKKTNVQIWAIVEQDQNPILSQNGLPTPISESGIQPPLLSSKIDALFNPMMLKFILQHPVQLGIKILKQIPAFWIFGENRTNSLGFFVMALFTFFIFIEGFLLLKDTSVFGYIVLAFTIYATLIYAVILAWARYSIITYPPMLIVGCYWAVQWIISKRQKQNNRLADL
ncbi:MAG TPA: hypothetical protein VKF38_05605 [Anaerolineaceae bacterium]|nr:hypothetical protein [Anaerolineaceae bacterium]